MPIVTRELQFSTPHGERVGHLAMPAQRRGALVVVHELFGRAPEMERVAERLAEAGYAALLPDLFGSRFKPFCVRQAVAELKHGRGEFLDVLRAAGDALAHSADVPRERVALIGFCLGAGLALAVGNAFAAVSANYGDVPEAEVMRGIGPTIACFGGRDRVFRASAERLRKRLAVVGVTPEVHVFEDAGHSFLSDGHHPVAAFLTRPLLHVHPVRDQPAREAGFATILAFLARHASV